MSVVKSIIHIILNSGSVNMAQPEPKGEKQLAFTVGQ